MADTLSNNFCSLCGFSFDRFNDEKQNKRTSLASPAVEESGLLERLNITVTPLRKELVFICYSCCTVFTNYTTAKANFQHREQEALKLLTEPVEGKEQEGQLPFVPYLKRRCLTRPPSSPPSRVSLTRQAKVPRLDHSAASSEDLEDDIKKEPNGEGTNEPSEQSESSTTGVKQEVVELLEKGCYSASLAKLWAGSREFREGCLSFLSLLVMKETTEVLQHDTLFSRTLNGGTLQEVSWGPTMEVLSRVAPATLCLLLALLGVDATKASSEAREAQHTMVGCLLSMALYKRFRKRANFLPALHTLYLHSTRTPPKVKGTLHQLGLTIPSFRLAAILKRLEVPNIDLARVWKKELELTLQMIQRKPKVEESPRKLPADRRKPRSILPKPIPVTSYGLYWGNVEVPTPSGQGTQVPSMAQAFAARGRVPFMMTYRDEGVRLADNISFEEFVPDSEDYIRVREQMKKEVQKILIKHMSLFEGLTVAEHHLYSDFVNQKSHMVDLGTVFKSPADNGSVASLMKDLKGYMASDEGEPVSMCIFGEQQSVVKMVRAKDVMSCFSEKQDRLDGLEPCTMDHSRQVLLAKDIVKIFFPHGLLEKSDSLHHLCLDKSVLDKCEASDFTALCTFLQVLAHSYTVALGENKLFRVMIDKINLSKEEKENILEKLCEDIVTDIWPSVDTESLDAVRQGNNVERDRECSFGDCVNFREKARLPCSERCARPFYFCCKKPLNDGLVECVRRENCPRGAWFHLNKKCSGLVEAPEDDWLCNACSAQQRVEGLSERTDGLWEYHRGLLWYCLFFWVGQAAESQGNGWLLHAVWKVSMPIFETQGHTEFLHQGYSFLSGVAGRIPRLAAHDSLHNRTISLTGGLNSNLSWDRAVELINKEIRGKSLQRDRVKDPASPRRAEACQLLSLTTAWEKQICNRKWAKAEELGPIRSYVTQIDTLGILQRVPGRQPPTEPAFSHVMQIKKPKNLVATLRELCEKDVTRQMNEQESEVSE